MNGVALQELRKQMSACWCVPAVTGTQPPERKRKWFLKKNWWILGLNIQPRRKTVIYKGYKLTERSKNFSSPPHSPHSLCPPPLACPQLSSPPHPPRSPPAVSAVITHHLKDLPWHLMWQNWISSLILWPSPSPCLIHAVTNWVACQRPGCVNGGLLVKTVRDLSSVSLSLSLLVY